MKTLLSLFVLFASLSVAMLPSSGAVTPRPKTSPVPAPQTATFETPTITSVRGRVVKVQIPSGYKQVKLERRTGRPALPWAALSTQTVDGSAKEVTFRLRAPWPKRLMRVVGQKMDPLPRNFYGGLSTFLAVPEAEGSSGTQVVTLDAGTLTLDIAGGVIANGGPMMTLAVSDATASSTSTGTTVILPTRDVVE